MKKLVLIGASTGGPGHIKKLVQDLRLEDAAVVIAQHMQADFFPSYAAQLDRECVSRVQLITQPMFINTAGIFICSRNTELQLNMRAAFNDGSFPFSPNVDLLFSSAARSARGLQVMAILLTGIGDDGARGLFDLYKTGARCIGEAQKSCIVYGMPKRAFELNPKLRQLELADIKRELDVFLRD